jgi:murein DD-endopeptidase MepM/ murein hydrolase activator NlpD
LLRLPASAPTANSDYHQELIKDINNTEFIKATPYVSKNQEWQLPVKSKILSLFGEPRQLPTHDEYFHKGLDQRAFLNTPVHAVSDGVVAQVQQNAVGGNTITIHHGGGIYTRYMHLNAVSFAKGDKVKRNQVLGLSGTTGRSEAPHLHWEVIINGLQVDPQVALSLLEDLERP